MIHRQPRITTNFTVVPNQILNDGNLIPVTVLAFSFEEDSAYWLTANSVVIAGVELRDGGEQ